MSTLSARLLLEAGGRSWTLHHGDVIGRLGTVGGDALRHYDVLSRQHLRVECLSGQWQVTLLPNVGNETLCNGVPMIEGEPVMVTDSCQIEVATLTLRLVPETSQTTAEHPAALLTLDAHLHIQWHNRAAGKLLCRELEVGSEFLTCIETGAALHLRHALISLREGSEISEYEAALHAGEGSPWVAIRGARAGDQWLLALRDVTAERQQRETVKQAAGRLDAKISALTTLLTARAFMAGDLAPALPLLVEDAAELLDDTQVSAWLLSGNHPRPAATPLPSPLALTRRASAGRAKPVVMGKEVQLSEIPERGLVARDTLVTLQTAGLLEPGTSTAWLEPFDDHGLLVFEREEAARQWLEPETRLIGLAAALGQQLFANVQRAEAMELLQAREAELTSELGEAAQYVERRLPAIIKEGPVAVDWIYQPCGKLGGDTFAYEWLDQDRFALCIADVMGHGSKAALHALSLSQALKLLWARGAEHDPATWLDALNKEFPMQANQDLLWTMWCGLYDRSTNALHYASGGHPPALLCHGEKVEPLTTGGPVLGAMVEARYHSASVILPPLSKLFLYSDGAFEYPIANGETATMEDFTAAVLDAAKMSAGECDFLRTRAAALCAEEGFPDDFTVVRARFAR